MDLKSVYDHFDTLLKQTLNDTVTELSDLDKQIAQLTDDVNQARQRGDLSENAEFQIAVDTRDFKMSTRHLVYNRLKTLESETGEYVSTGTAALGSVVKFKLLTPVAEDSKYKTDFTMKIVSHILGDARKGFLANDSCVGKQLLGRRAGDTVEVVAPFGTLEYKIEGVY